MLTKFTKYKPECLFLSIQEGVTTLILTMGINICYPGHTLNWIKVLWRPNIKHLVFMIYHENNSAKGLFTAGVWPKPLIP